MKLHYLPVILLFNGLFFIPTGHGAKSQAAKVVKISETQFEVDRSFCNKIDATVLQTVFAIPYFQDNEILGFKLQSIDPGSLALEVGFAANDILLEVNGKPANSLGNLQETEKTLCKNKTATAVVLRNEKRLTLNYKIKP